MQEEEYPRSRDAQHAFSFGAWRRSLKEANFYVPRAVLRVSMHRHSAGRAVAAPIRDLVPSLHLGTVEVQKLVNADTMANKSHLTYKILNLHTILKETHDKASPLLFSFSVNNVKFDIEISYCHWRHSRCQNPLVSGTPQGRNRNFLFEINDDNQSRQEQTRKYFDRSKPYKALKQHTGHLFLN